MKIHQVITPEQVVIDYRIAEAPSRVLASAIDMLYQTLGIIVLLLINLMVMSYWEDFYAQYYDWLLALSLLMGFLMMFGYGVYFEFAWSGQTPGKTQVGLRVIRLNGEPVSLSHVLVRNLFKYLIDWLGIGLWMMLLEKQSRRIGDMVSSTVVVYADMT